MPKIKPLILTLLLAIILYLVGGFFFVKSLPSQPYLGFEKINISDPLDGLVVFTGGSNRIKEAVSFLKIGYSDRLLISGVHPKVTLDKIANNLAITPQQKSQIELDYEALSTKDNVAVTLGWAKSQGFQRIGLVTAYYHIPRSLMLFERTSSDISLKIFPVFPNIVPPSFLFREYNKYIMTFLGVM